MERCSRCTRSPHTYPPRSCGASARRYSMRSPRVLGLPVLWVLNEFWSRRVFLACSDSTVASRFDSET
ncbi:hypothetical protein EYF80_027237 [Liparis tanakae]|uniref:Uncharacterized protein n=1 Tax=Liparis tanakae TaxID=230148 RepID=A0A4Z2HCB1_9TELE|nr:hypothetical protein EYF80_027237 [Liparis tanakae]